MSARDFFSHFKFASCIFPSIILQFASQLTNGFFLLAFYALIFRSLVFSRNFFHIFLGVSFPWASVARRTGGWFGTMDSDFRGSVCFHPLGPVVSLAFIFSAIWFMVHGSFM